MAGSGTKDDPWQLTTAPGTSQFTMYRDDAADPPVLVCQVGSTQAHVRRSGDRRPARDAGRRPGTGCRSGRATSRRIRRPAPSRSGAGRPGNPVGGWYGLRKGYRGRFGMYLPPLLEELGLVELEHNARNNRARALNP